MIVETTLEEMKTSDDWKEALAVCQPPEPIAGDSCPLDRFTLEDVEDVLASQDGQNDGDHWLALFRLKDSRYAFITAWCDYTGWGCQDGGHSWVSNDLEHIIQFGMGADDRSALEVTL